MGGNNLSRSEAEVNLAVMRILDEEEIVAPLLLLHDEYQSFLDHVHEDDCNERHPLCDQCIDEFLRRVADSHLTPEANPPAMLDELDAS